MSGFQLKKYMKYIYDVLQPKEVVMESLQQLDHKDKTLAPNMA